MRCIIVDCEKLIQCYVWVFVLKFRNFQYFVQIVQYGFIGRISSWLVRFDLTMLETVPLSKLFVIVQLERWSIIGFFIENDVQSCWGVLSAWVRQHRMRHLLLQLFFDHVTIVKCYWSEGCFNQSRALPLCLWWIRACKWIALETSKPVRLCLALFLSLLGSHLVRSLSWNLGWKWPSRKV